MPDPDADAKVAVLLRAMRAIEASMAGLRDYPIVVEALRKCAIQFHDEAARLDPLPQSPAWEE